MQEISDHVNELVPSFPGEMSDKRKKDLKVCKPTGRQLTNHELIEAPHCTGILSNFELFGGPRGNQVDANQDLDLEFEFVEDI